MIFLDLVMVVPGLPFAVPNLHKSNAPFDQSPCHQQLTRLRRFAVAFANEFRLPLNVKCIRRFHLHPIRLLVALDARLQLRIMPALVQMFSIQRLQQVELATLRGKIQSRIANILDQFFHCGVFCVHIHTLVRCPAKMTTASCPALSPDDRPDTSR